MSTPALHEAISKAFDITWVREQFPSLQLKLNGQQAAFLDGPAGTQVPQQVMDAVQKYFLEANANQRAVQGGVEVPDLAGGVHPRAKLVFAHQNFEAGRICRRLAKAPKGHSNW